MSIRQFRPMTAGTRFRSVSGFDEITRDTPEKSLLEPMKRSGGRNNQGHLTSRHRGGGHKRQYRKIDFKRNKVGIPGRVAEIEYDPNRTARIALIVYADGEKRYILHPKGLNQGDTVISGPGSDTRTGNALPLGEIPLGTTVHNIELKIGKGGQLCRTAGSSAQVVAKEGEYVTLRLRSTEMRLIHGRCFATVGEVGNARARAALGRQGGQEPLAGQAAQGPRRGHEPGGPPARRRRGQELGRPSSDVAVGQARGPQDPASEEGVHQADRPRAGKRGKGDEVRHGEKRQRRARSFRTR